MSEIENRAPLVHKWIREIELYEQKTSKWNKRAKKILKRYKDDRGDNESSSVRYNVLWSFVQTLRPALYAREPKVIVGRRYLDKDPVALKASDALERASAYMLKEQDFDCIARQCVDDNLLVGRATAWVRYVPHIQGQSVEGEDEEAKDIAEDGPQLTNDADEEEESDEVVTWEESLIDYVNWEDFGHTLDRTWAEVRGVWRMCYLGRKELVKRFGEEIGNKVSLDYQAKDLNGANIASTSNSKAVVYEIWDKVERKAIWLCKTYPEPLDVLEDPLGLKDFFPCPRPLYATLTTDSLIPTPDYIEWQDQAQELDTLTGRIAAITKAIKVAGVRDATASGLESLLNQGLENTLVPVDGWAVFGEKGGLVGAMQLLPMQEIAATLLSLYDARERVKQDLYEITGMADIIRGANDPSATATAERIKSKFVTMRLSERQRDVQRFVRDVIALQAEIIAAHFDIETIAKISGLDLFTAEEKGQVEQQIQMQQMQAQTQQAPQLPYDLQEKLRAPTWDEVNELLKNDALRMFRIDIETDSTIIEDEEQEKASRIEFLGAVSGFMKEAVPAAESNPLLAPVLGQMLLFGVRAFRAGRELEGCFENLVEELEKAAKQPKPQAPDPEQIKAQTAMQIEQFKAQSKAQSDAEKMQMEQQFAERNAQIELQLEQQRMAMETENARREQLYQAQQNEHQQTLEAQRYAQEQATAAQLEQQRMAFEERLKASEQQLQLMIAQINNAAKVEVAEIAAQTTLNAAQISAAKSSTMEGI